MDSCPVCGSDMGKDAKACSVCGTAYESASKQCPLCDAPVSDSDDKCPNCEADLRVLDEALNGSDTDTLEEVVDTVEAPTPQEINDAGEIASSVFVDVELEELVKLPGIGPLRAKILFDAGFTDLRKLKQASVVELMNIRGIGRKAAGEIKTALRELSLEQIRETPLTEETVGAEHQCPLCATIVSAFETSCYECGCAINTQGVEEGDSDRLALSYYDSKLLRSPDSKDLWYARGATLVKIGNYEQALSSYNRALEIDPSFQTAWMSKAEVYNTLGESAKAAECYSHIITSTSGGIIPGSEQEDSDDEELSLEPPEQPREPEMEVAELDLTRPPAEAAPEPAPTPGPEIIQAASTMAEIKMDFEKQVQRPDYDSMTEEELKKALSSRATRVKPYLKIAKEVGVDINHAKRLVSRAVSESKQNEFKIAVLLMDEGIEFAENELRKKISEDIDNLATLVRNLKSQGKDVSVAVELITSSKDLLESGDIVESLEKLKACLELVERIASQ